MNIHILYILTRSKFSKGITSALFRIDVHSFGVALVYIKSFIFCDSRMMS